MANDRETLYSRIAVAAPMLRGNEKRYVLECLETTWISSIGRFITEFERGFARYCRVEHAVAVNNGTSALHVALVALGVKPGDEVIVPSLTYVATANAVTYCGAKPVLVDCNPQTLNIDPAAIARKITGRTKGIIPVHLYGHPADMDPIVDVAREHGLFVLEDAAEAHGAEYRGRRVGGLGNCATFSFFGNKIMTTGEGGMVTTNDGDLAAKLVLYRGQGLDPGRRYWHPVVGYNYRMTNIAAALGLAQLERIEELIQARARLADWYRPRLERLANKLVTQAAEPCSRPVLWMQTVMLRYGGEAERDAVMRKLDAAGIETRPVFYPMHVLPPYRENATLYPNATRCAARGISLPTHGLLTEADVDRICGALDADENLGMKIALCSSFVPFINGGYRFIVEWLERKLAENGHAVERIYLPFVEDPRDMLAQMVAYRLIDLTESCDRLIAFRPPSYMIRHRCKVVWFIHHLRGYYDMWESEYRPVPDSVAGRAIRDSVFAADNVALREARKIFANSRTVSSRLRQFNGVASEVLYPPVQEPERFHCNSYGDEIVCISRVEPHKRQHLLIEALVHTRTPVKLRLCGISTSATYGDELKALIVRLGIEDRVILEQRWISEEEKTDRLASALAVGYVPSDEDSYGYPSLEGGHARKAVLTTTDSGGVTEFVVDGANGFVCVPEPQALGDAMDRLFLDRSLATAMGRTARQRIFDLGISWDRVVQKLLA